MKKQLILVIALITNSLLCSVPENLGVSSERANALLMNSLRGLTG